MITRQNYASLRLTGISFWLICYNLMFLFLWTVANTSKKHGIQEILFCWNVSFLIFREFCKRMDRNLPFYYWTANKRFRDWDDDLPSFNERPEVADDKDPINHPLRLHRLTINCREDLSVFTAGYSFLPARNKTTVHQRLHRPVVNLPPALWLAGSACDTK